MSKTYKPLKIEDSRISNLENFGDRNDLAGAVIIEKIDQGKCYPELAEISYYTNSQKDKTEFTTEMVYVAGISGKQYRRSDWELSSEIYSLFIFPVKNFNGEKWKESKMRSIPLEDLINYKKLRYSK